MEQDVDELIDFTSSISSQLPNSEEDKTFRFFADTIGELPEVLESKHLVIKKGFHDYGSSWRIDYPQVYASKQTYEALGIVAAGVLLNAKTQQLEVRLVHPESEIKSLFIEFFHTDLSVEYLHGLYTTPTLFAYEVSAIERHPWLHDHIMDHSSFPKFELTNRTRELVTENDWSNRDVLFGFGSAQGTARLIQLFLDMSRPDNNRYEVVLESMSGFGGVAHASAEMRFWLPGGDYWFE